MKPFEFCTRQKINLGRIGFILLAFILLLRLTVGVDFSDEAYYAFFLDDWLKGSIASSTFLTIHQTAAFLVYPFCLAYFKLHHSTNGLFLFLRCLFLLFNLSAAFAWMFFLRRLNFHAATWLGGIMVLAFIPFGLPAPSYNTLSSQFLIIALAGLGSLLTYKEFSTAQLIWMIISAIAWVIAIIAYPSLLGAWLFLCCLILLYRSTFSRPWIYLALLISALCIGWIILVGSLSFNRLYQSVLYLSSINDRPYKKNRVHFNIF